jgi:hypothetical protein
MFECKQCERKFTSQRGLSMHLHKCVVGDPRVVKLEKQIATTRDAVAKHQLEMELKELKNGTTRS